MSKFIAAKANDYIDDAMNNTGKGEITSKEIKDKKTQQQKYTPAKMKKLFKKMKKLFLNLKKKNKKKKRKNWS